MSRDNDDRLFSSGEWFERPEGGKAGRWIPSGPPPEIAALETTAIRELRPELARFASEVERRLQKHDAYKGDSWKDWSIWNLARLLDSEARETLIEAARENVPKTASEALDVGAVAMMVWNRADSSEEETGG